MIKMIILSKHKINFNLIGNCFYTLVTYLVINIIFYIQRIIISFADK